jgi:hypothetical protein
MCNTLECLEPGASLAKGALFAAQPSLDRPKVKDFGAKSAPDSGDQRSKKRFLNPFGQKPR